MKRLFVLPVVATLLMATAASAETPPGPPPGGDGAPCDHMGGMKHRHGAGMWGRENPLASLPKPLTPDSVKKAMEAEFAKRPHVGSITEKDANTLVVEVVSADGNTTHKFAIDRNTGARLPNR